MESTVDPATIRAARREDIAAVLSVWEQARTAYALWRSVGYRFDERIVRFVRNL